jgi:hypothetical protein
MPLSQSLKYFDYRLVTALLANNFNSVVQAPLGQGLAVTSNSTWWHMNWLIVSWSTKEGPNDLG